MNQKSNSNFIPLNLKHLINHKIYDSHLSSIGIELPCIINTINSHSYCEAKKDKTFANALLSSDLLLPDGVGIVYATKILTGKKIKKIAGADIHKYLLEEADKKHQKVFYLGASKSTLQIIEKKIKKEFPNINVGSYSPPYKPEFSCEETNTMIRTVNIAKPDILFVGMTAPKQEKWVHANKENINVKTIASIGAVFDFYAGTYKRAPEWMLSLGLEWLHRSLGSWRLAKRNLISIPLFFKEILIEKLL